MVSKRVVRGKKGKMKLLCELRFLEQNLDFCMRMKSDLRKGFLKQDVDHLLYLRYASRIRSLKGRISITKSALSDFKKK